MQGDARRKKDQSSTKNVLGLSAPFYLEKKMGAGLG